MNAAEIKFDATVVRTGRIRGRSQSWKTTEGQTDSKVYAATAAPSTKTKNARDEVSFGMSG